VVWAENGHPQGNRVKESQVYP